jgi:isopentenyl diphosphate isomerase/L-lactate dehydrogenase-like FMN-dependent dehydrogenase
VAGEDGVSHVLKNILAELDLTLALCGLTSPAQLDRAALQRGPG